MPGTYSRLIIHVVFSVKFRQPLILPEFENDLFNYIGGIVRNRGQILICANGTKDHIHLLIITKPSCLLSSLIKEIKRSSTLFIRKRKPYLQDFSWQTGYAAFSCNSKSFNDILSYIKNQKEHHKAKGFKTEYESLIIENKIPFNEKYLFE